MRSRSWAAMFGGQRRRNDGQRPRSPAGRPGDLLMPPTPLGLLSFDQACTRKSHSEVRLRRTRTLSRATRPTLTHFGVRAEANPDSERFRFGPKSESNGYGISRDV